MRRRRWSRDEAIIALELYFRRKPRELAKDDEEIAQLSSLLKRTPNAIYMKLCNFLALDPEYHGNGLSHISRDDKEVWNSFVGRRYQARVEASAARHRVA